MMYKTLDKKSLKKFFQIVYYVPGLELLRKLGFSEGEGTSLSFISPPDLCKM